ncbi:MAG: chemotaxis protein CheW [Burkholderiaceae bacterium]
MANRQSLKELQERLAQRLSAARSEAVSVSWLAVEAGGQRYLFPLVQSGEIFSWTGVRPVPYTKSWYLGVAALRGGLQGVVDLAQMVRGTVRATAPADRVTSESRLVSLHGALGVNAVLLVDRLLGLRQPSGFVRVESVPDGSPSFVTRVLSDSEGTSWHELDLQALAGDPEFLAIAA